MIDRIAARWISQGAQEHPEVVYVAVFLTPMERARLIKRFGKTHPELEAHHMTIWHQTADGGNSGLEQLPLGKTFPLKILGYAENERVQAVVVKSPVNVRPRSGRVPHITLSIAVGASAKDSNALLANSSSIVWESGLPTVEGKLGWWDGTKERFDLPLK